MNSSANAWVDANSCPWQACPNYNAMIYYANVTIYGGGGAGTNYSCPSINLCIAANCNDLPDYMTPTYLNLTGPNKYAIECEKDGISVPLVQISLPSSGRSIRGDTLVALIAIGISLLVCGSASI
jgi:hypothetical protein